MSYTQNEKTMSITEKTLAVGIDIEKDVQYARAFDGRGIFMKKRFLAILSFVLILTFSLNGNYIAKAENLSSWIEFPRMEGLPVNKTFTVNFSTNVQAEKIDAIVIEQNNRFIPVDITYNLEKAYITPVKPFGEGEYTLKIILSNGNKYLQRFTTTNIEKTVSNRSSDKIIKVYPKASSGFSYPYYLSIPNNLDTSKEVHFLVEPNNNGQAGNSDFQDILVKKGILNETTMSANINKKINSIILMPVFPRGVTVEGEDNWKLYTHELDRDTILGNDHEKIKIDDQLANMIKDAKSIVSKEGITSIKDKVFMMGFSASARFANRFALLHPELVQAVATGGINANPILPLKELSGQKLIYPVGIGDAEEILKRSINLEEYKNVKQYIFMGELDTNDDVPYGDGYDEPERQLIYNLIGKNQLPDRWNKTQEIFKNLSYPMQFVTYKGIGHGLNNTIYNDLTMFFNQNQ